MSKMKEVKATAQAPILTTARMGPTGRQTFFKGGEQLFGREAREASRKPSACTVVTVKK